MPNASKTAPNVTVTQVDGSGAVGEFDSTITERETFSQIRGFTLGGLAPNTTYYFVACSGTYSLPFQLVISGTLSAYVARRFTCQLCWNSNPGASIRITNNILTATYDSYYRLGNLLWGQDTSGQLPAPPASQTTASSVLSGISTNNPGSDPSALFTGNVILPMINSGYSSNTPANYALAAAAYTPVNCSLYWSSLPGNTCIGDVTTTTANSALSKVGLWGPLGNLSGYPTVGNWRLRYNSPYISGGKPAGTNPTTDGLDAGADIDQIEAAQGVISNVHLFFTALGPTISFLAPDSFSCSIDVDPSSDNGNFTPGVFSRVPGSAVSGTGRRAQQNVMLSGLTAHAQYTLRVNCSSQQPTINLQMP